MISLSINVNVKVPNKLIENATKVLFVNIKFLFEIEEFLSEIDELLLETNEIEIEILLKIDANNIEINKIIY